MTELIELLACPRCDKTPLESSEDGLRCTACKIDYPAIEGMPWLFAEPAAALGEWRGRLQFALQKIGHDVAGIDHELRKKDLRDLTRRRLERHRKALDEYRRALQKLLRPLEVQLLSGNYESYLALRTRLPADQGLNTYYANIHRDWAWGDEENRAQSR